MASVKVRGGEKSVCFLLILGLATVATALQCTPDCTCEQNRIECHHCSSLPGKGTLPTDAKDMVFRIEHCKINTIPSGYFDGIASNSMHIHMEHSEVETFQSNLINDLDLTLRLTFEHHNLTNILENAFRVGQISEISMVHSQTTTLAENAIHAEQEISRIHLEHSELTTLESNGITAPQIETVELEHSSISDVQQHAFQTPSIGTLKLEHSEFTDMADLALENVDLETLDMDHSEVYGDQPFTGLSRMGSMQMRHSSLDILRVRSIATDFPWGTGSHLIHVDLHEIEEGTFDGYELDISEDSVCAVGVQCDQRVHWMMGEQSTLPDMLFKNILCYAESGSNERAILHTCSLESGQLQNCEYIHVNDVKCDGCSHVVTVLPLLLVALLVVMIQNTVL